MQSDNNEIVDTESGKLIKNIWNEMLLLGFGFLGGNKCSKRWVERWEKGGYFLSLKLINSKRNFSIINIYHKFPALQSKNKFPFKS